MDLRSPVLRAMLVVLLSCSHGSEPHYVVRGTVTDCWQSKKMPVRDVEVRLYERSKENAPLHEQVTALETMQRKTNGDDATEFFSEYEKFARALRASHPLELKKTSANGSFRLERAIKNKSYFIIFFAQLEDEPVYFRYLDFDTSKQIVELAVAMSDEPCRA